jgi:hypothetical protein
MMDLMEMGCQDVGQWNLFRTISMADLSINDIKPSGSVTTVLRRFSSLLHKEQRFKRKLHSTWMNLEKFRREINITGTARRSVKTEDGRILSNMTELHVKNKRGGKGYCNVECICAI